MECCFLAQRYRHIIFLIQKTRQEAFHPPFGHSLAGVLTCNHPYNFLARSDREAIHILALNSLAQNTQRHALLQSRFGHNISMTIHRVWRKIGIINAIMLGRMFNDKLPIDIACCWHTKPRFAVITGASLIAVPTARKRRVFGIFQDHFQRLALGSAHAIIEPLKKVGIIIRPNSEANIV